MRARSATPAAVERAATIPAMPARPRVSAPAFVRLVAEVPFAAVEVVAVVLVVPAVEATEVVEPVLLFAVAAAAHPPVPLHVVDVEPLVVWLVPFELPVELPPEFELPLWVPLTPVDATCTEPLLVEVAEVAGLLVRLPLTSTLNVEPAAAAPLALPPA